MKKKIIFGIVFLLLSSFVYAEVGAGTQQNPYNISNCAQLNESNTLNVSGVFQLVNDLDCAGYNFGSEMFTNFYGNFSGNDYSISNFTMSNPAQYGMTFIRTLRGGILENIKFINVDVTGDNVMGIVGQCYIDSCTIKNVIVEGNIVSGDNEVGGIIGKVFAGSVLENVTFNGTINGDVRTGGIIGLAQGTNTLNNVGSMGTINPTNSGESGGIIGSCSNTCIINNSYSTMTITGSASSTKSGLIGRCTSGGVNCEIENSFFAGTVPLYTNHAVLFGNASQLTTSINNYYDSDTTGTTNATQGTPIPTSEFQNESRFTSNNWDFVNVWSYQDTYIYPQLSFAFEEIIIPFTQQYTYINNCSEFKYYISQPNANLSLNNSIDCEQETFNSVTTNLIRLNCNNSKIENLHLINDSSLFSNNVYLSNCIFENSDAVLNKTDGGATAFLFASETSRTTIIENITFINVSVINEIATTQGTGLLYGEQANIGEIRRLNNINAYNSNVYAYKDNSSNYIGGLIGKTYALDISNSTFENGIIRNGNNWFGGIAGACPRCGFYDTYTTGQMQVNSNTRQGGLTGEINGGANYNMTRVYSAIEMPSGAGGLIGRLTTVNYTISQAYFDNQTTGTNNACQSGCSITGKTTNELRNESLYSTWDFVNIWKMFNSYPFFIDAPIFEAISNLTLTSPLQFGIYSQNLLIDWIFTDKDNVFAIATVKLINESVFYLESTYNNNISVDSSIYADRSDYLTNITITDKYKRNTTVQAQFELDNTAPILTINNESLSNGSVTGSCSDLNYLSVVVNDTRFNISGNFEIVSTVNGLISLNVTCNDVAGNSAHKVFSSTYDISAPSCSALSDLSGITVNDTFIINTTCSDERILENATLSCSNSLIDFDSNVANTTLSVVATGITSAFTCNVFASDGLRNNEPGYGTAK